MFPESDMPEPSLIPQTGLQDSFVMDPNTAIKWGLASETNSSQDRINRLWWIIENKFGPYGSTFSFVGEEWRAEFMVVTRRVVFRKDHKGMDSATIPQFKEGDEEKVLRRLPEEKSLDHLAFATRLDSQG